MSRRAVIVATARTGLAKSFRGGFNKTHGAALAGHAIQSVIAKASIDVCAELSITNVLNNNSCYKACPC